MFHIKKRFFFRPVSEKLENLVDGQIDLSQAKILTRELLTTNSQFEPGEKRLNHEAIALLLYAFSQTRFPIFLETNPKDAFKEEKEKNLSSINEALSAEEKHSPIVANHQKKIFISAGPEDLKALLSYLRFQLHEEGSEAFIFYRPYIHSMGLYFRVWQGTLYCFLFDSQNWGLRYPATDLGIKAILQYLPNCKIILFGTELQEKKMQRGCTEYTLTYAEYCLKKGDILVQDFSQRSMKPLTIYDNTYQLEEGAIPDQLLALKEKHLIEKKHKLYISYLQEILFRNYILDGKLNRSKIFEIVREMQGCNLIEPIVFDYSSLYSIHVNLEKKQVFIDFSKHNYLFRNFPTFSNEIFPKNVCKQPTKNLLDNNENIKVTLIEKDEIIQLVYSTTDEFSALEQAFRTLRHRGSEFYTQHIRQQLALEKFAVEVLNEIEITKICQNNIKGGFDQEQVQYILRYFLINAKVYVPSCSELSDEKLPLDLIRNQNYYQVAFSLQVGKFHQVAVWIEWHDDRWDITIFDSLSSSNINEETLRFLRTKLDLTHDYPIDVITCSQQKDDFSCGAWVVYNILARQGIILSANIREWIRVCNRAYNLRKPIETALNDQMEKNNSTKQSLLKIIENYRKKNGFYSSVFHETNEINLEKHDTFLQIADFLQLEMWGNLERQEELETQTKRRNQSYELIRTRSLLDTIHAYNKANDPDGLFLLEISVVASNRDENDYIPTIKQAVKIIAAKAEENEPAEAEDISTVISFFEMELNFELPENKGEKIDFLETLFAMICCPKKDEDFLTLESIESILKEILHKLFKDRVAQYVRYAGEKNVSPCFLLYSILNIISKTVITI